MNRQKNYCRKCSEILILEKNWYKASFDKKDYICKKCSTKYKSKNKTIDQFTKEEQEIKRAYWREANKKRDPIERRNNSLMSNYGINNDDYESLLKKQNFCCKICKTDKPSGGKGNKYFAVDHFIDNYGKKIVRGLLCQNCNQGLGKFKDDPNLFLECIDYINTHKEINYNRQEKWDRRFLNLAKFISSFSKDPSTKVGAIIVNDDNQVLGIGYNGFPKNVIDSDERLIDRENKLRMIVHAEANAILSAKTNLAGCTLYTSLFSCCDCAKLIIQSGIVRVVSPPIDTKFERFKESFEAAQMMYKETGVEVNFIKEN